MRVGIVSLGGTSSKSIAASCRKYFDQVDLLDIRRFEVHVSNEGIEVTYEDRGLDKYDCIYIRGSYKYALLQRSITRALCHEVYMPVRPESFTIGHDKFLTLLELQRHKVEIPKTYYAATTPLAKRIIENYVDYPIIMKVSEGTHGKGVLMADSPASAKTVLDILEDFKKPYIIQEFVKTRRTTDVRAIVLGNRVVAAYQRRAARGEVRANVHSGGKRLKHELTKEEKKLAIVSAKAIGAHVCGVDILNAKEPSVIEINLSPGVESAKEVTGVDISRKIAKFLFEKTKKFKEAKKKQPRKDIKNQIAPIL